MSAELIYICKIKIYNSYTWKSTFRVQNLSCDYMLTGPYTTVLSSVGQNRSRLKGRENTIKVGEIVALLYSKVFVCMV